MASIGPITRIARTNPDPQTARQAGQDANRLARRAVSQKAVGPASKTTLSPKAQEILATQPQKDGLSTSTTALTVVASSFGLVGYKGGFFNFNNREKKS